MTPTELEAYEAFCKNNDKYTEQEIDYLKSSLENYFLHKPSAQLSEHLKENPCEPLQIARDRRIVDYLHKKKGLKLRRAVSLWSDWEDYEYELKGGN